MGTVYDLPTLVPQHVPWGAGLVFAGVLLVTWVVRTLLKPEAVANIVLWLLGAMVGVATAYERSGSIVDTGAAVLLGALLACLVLPLASLVVRVLSGRAVEVSVSNGTVSASRDVAPGASDESVESSAAPPPRRWSVRPSFPPPGSRATCKHGLHYDPLRSAGCALCEREMGVASAPPAARAASPFVVGVVGFGAVGVAAAIVWSLYGMEPEVAASDDPPMITSSADDPANASTEAIPPPAGTSNGRVVLPPPTEAQPWKGPRDAPVVVQVFGDLQCPYTKKVVPALQRLVVDFPRKVMLVFRNAPQPFHKLARPAARVALEAFRRKGPGAFWELRDRIQNDVGTTRGLTAEGIFRHAAELGLGERASRTAFDGSDELDDVLDTDVALAREFGFDATPTTVVNGIVIRGAQPDPDYENAVRRALEELAARSANSAAQTFASPSERLREP